MSLTRYKEIGRVRHMLLGCCEETADVEISLNYLDKINNPGFEAEQHSLEQLFGFKDYEAFKINDKKTAVYLLC